MRRLYPIFAAAVILAMTLTGCAAPATDQPEPTPITPGGASPQGTLGLAEELRGAGAAVEALLADALGDPIAVGAAPWLP